MLERVDDKRLTLLLRGSLGLHVSLPASGVGLDRYGLSEEIISFAGYTNV